MTCNLKHNEPGEICIAVAVNFSLCTVSCLTTPRRPGLYWRFNFPGVNSSHVPVDEGLKKLSYAGASKVQHIQGKHFQVREGKEITYPRISQMASSGM
ncbi:hypothetical protein J6590_056862 [Homalodisca vitripennis]|nr:hypothetical protein J6590_056862 [Homalodisca vitripennis]